MTGKTIRTMAAMALAAMLPCAGGALAIEAPMAIAGGALDPALPGADVYLAAPQPGSVPPGPACDTARRYVELVNAGDFAGVSALYADDAFILEPTRQTVRGRAAIDTFYTGRIGQMRPQLVAVSYLGNDRECMVELTRQIELAGQQRHVLVSIDHFTMGTGGKVANMVAFARPPRN